MIPTTWHSVYATVREVERRSFCWPILDGPGCPRTVASERLSIQGHRCLETERPRVITSTCQWCGIPFAIYPSHLARRRCCSRACKANSERATPSEKEQTARRVRSHHRQQAEQNNAYLRDYQHRYPEKRREANQRYQAKYPERVREQHRRWREAHPNIGLARRCRTYDIVRMLDQQQSRCWWCKKPILKAYHADHRIPLAKGGSNDPSNIVLACPKCNFSKGAKLPEEFAGRLF